MLNACWHKLHADPITVGGKQMLVRTADQQASALLHGVSSAANNCTGRTNSLIPDILRSFIVDARCCCASRRSADECELELAASCSQGLLLASCIV